MVHFDSKKNILATHCFVCIIFPHHFLAPLSQITLELLVNVNDILTSTSSC